MIGPLVPARVTAGKSARSATKSIERLLGVQADASRWSTSRPIPAGLSGFISMPAIARSLMDWDNPGAAPSGMASRNALSAATRARRRRPLDRPDLDQHGRVPEAAALRAWRHRARRLSGLCARPRGAETPRALCLYASDAEIFDFRPGRYKTEEKLGRRQRMGAHGSRPSRA